MSDVSAKQIAEHLASDELIHHPAYQRADEATHHLLSHVQMLAERVAILEAAHSPKGADTHPEGAQKETPP